MHIVATGLRYHVYGTSRLTSVVSVHSRNFSGTSSLSSAKTASSKSYSSTLLLPKTRFKLWPDYAQRDKLLAQRTNDGLYAKQWENNKGPIFILHDGPPYANGALHMGHSLNKVLKDIIIRFNALRGKRVNYMPGWDCHGLPIEIKTLEQLNAPPNTLPPVEVRKHAEKFARKQVKSQMAEFQKFGIMTSWEESNTYRTIDKDYELRQLRLLQALVRKKLIYRRHKPVFWSPSSQSALAEAEVQYNDAHISRSVYVTFRVDSSPSTKLKEILSNEKEGVDLLVWTTTPWTLPANMGIAVGEEMEYAVLRTKGESSKVLIVASDLLKSLHRIIGEHEILARLPGSELVGTAYTSPAFASPSPNSNPLRIISSKHVTSTSGTGIVHMAPAHGAEDYAAFLSHGLLDDPASSVICPVDNAGRYTFQLVDLARSREHGKRLVGKEVLGEGGREIIGILEESGMLVREEKYEHRYPYDTRTGKPMIIRATSQWFADVGAIKSQALEALKEVNFHPPSARARLEAFIRERSEWCISRQRVWGSPIPSLHDASTGEAILTSESMEHIISVLKERGVSYWWSGPVEEFVPPSLREEGRTFVKGTDTIDVWFDSGSSWTMLNAVPSNSDAQTQSRVRVADVCLEGSDQHRGWFQSLLLTAVASAEEGEPVVAPFRNLVSHGFVLDEKGRKMSKSVGNIVAPSVVISGGKDLKKEPAYGVDVLRLWAAGVDYTKDVSVGPTALGQVAESLRKLRNTARFMLGNIGDGKEFAPVSVDEMTLLDKYIMHELYTLEQKALEAYEGFSMHSVVQLLNSFSNSVLSSLYFDITKDVLYTEPLDGPARRSVITVLDKTLDVYSSIIAPILPQLAEEIHDCRAASSSNGSSIFEQGWKAVDATWNNPEVALDMTHLLQLRDRVLQLLETARRDGRIRSALESVVSIEVTGNIESADDSRLAALVEAHLPELKALFIVSNVSLDRSPASSGPRATTEWEYIADYKGLRIAVQPSPDHKCSRCWQYTAEAEDSLCSRCDSIVHA